MLERFGMAPYARGGRSAIQRRERSRAIRQLAEALKRALNESQNYESILASLVDGLRPKDDPPF